MTEPCAVYTLGSMKCMPFYLDNTVQHYPWGSTSAIPGLLGIEADGRPYAELWMGDHPRGPSKVRLSGESQPVELGTLIRRSPEWFLGSSSLERFGEGLPYLFKVLAAAEPLSIQAHPDRKQAEEGFDREDAAGIPVDAPHRNYRDRNHKPEIIAALTPFTAMCGFRKVQDIRERFGEIGGRAVSGHLLPALNKPDESAALSSFFSSLLGLNDEMKSDLLRATSEWCESVKGTVSDAELVARFLRLHPRDPSATAPLYLNVVRLMPGEALYQPAGLLHAYVEGTGIELMANSDNVLRGGLTGKHMDINELESVLTFASVRPSVLQPVTGGGGLQRYEADVREFALERFVGGRADLHPGSPVIVLATEGNMVLACGDTSAGLEKGTSVFIPAACSASISGDGTAYIATVPATGGS